MNQSVNVQQDQLQELRHAWAELKQQNPHLRIRNAAEQLNVSEMELLLTQEAGRVVRLDVPMGKLMQALEGLGPVMTLARNDQMVHETKGRVENFKVMAEGKMGLCLGAIDLRTFLSHWQHGFAVSEAQSDGSDRLSIQIFSASGDAIFKIYAIDATDRSAWQALIQQHQAAEQRPVLQLQARASIQRKADPAFGWTALEADWSQLKDVHDFHDLLKKHNVDRRSALDHISERWAIRLQPDSLEKVLQRSAETVTPIMAFVGNPGIVQIYTGPVNKLLRTGPWFNVLDPTFNLHANTEQLESVWQVVRPSEDGDITSLECFNHQGELVLTLFGERKPGKPELESWRARMAELERL